MYFLILGTVLGFSAILLPQLRDEMSLSSDEASWIAALSNIGQLFGAVMTGVLSGKFGRRPTLMILCVPLLAGWATVGLAGDRVWMFYLGRVLQGVGVMSSVTQVYLVEVADTERRGLFGASGALSVSVGITLVYCLGAVLHWRFVCLVGGLFPIITFIAMMFLPETPPWLVINDKKDEAEKVLRWLRGETYSFGQMLHEEFSLSQEKCTILALRSALSLKLQEEGRAPLWARHWRFSRGPQLISHSSSSCSCSSSSSFPEATPSSFTLSTCSVTSACPPTPTSPPSSPA